MPIAAAQAEPVESAVLPRLPAPALRAVVRRYVGYWQRNVPARAHRGLPSGSLTLVISLADPIRLTASPDPTQPPGDFAACLGGLHTAPAVIQQGRFQTGIHVELDPLGAPQLLGRPAGELSSTVVDAAALPVRWIRGLADRLVAAPTWSRRFELLDEVLTAALVERREPDAEVE